MAFFGDELAVVQIDFGFAAGEGGGVGIISGVVGGGRVVDEGVGVAPLGGTAGLGDIALAAWTVRDGTDAVDGRGAAEGG